MAHTRHEDRHHHFSITEILAIFKTSRVYIQILANALSGAEHPEGQLTLAERVKDCNILC
ncbi:hypothetical protein RRF57_009808 [Xylaria bambusicola]|uniref:Uncharacterized protein n=1 Tax=Xylaria bambusicola TaxID=326684 RepID=A0AAN7UZY7_9PEZI